MICYKFPDEETFRNFSDIEGFLDPETGNFVNSNGATELDVIGVISFYP